MEKAQEKNIFINQIGYLPEDKKIAFLTEAAGNQNCTFELCEANSKKIVFSGKIRAKNDDGSKFVDSAVGEEIFTADFSDFSQEGQFFIRIGEQESFPFEIKSQVYKNLYYSALNYFNLSRCGQNFCHIADAEIYGTNETKNVQGGWHDAGDYGRYIVPTAKTVMDLLLAYDSSKEVFTDFDILKEVRFALEWMLKMQREDGAVYHKVSCYHFCAFINPEDEKDKLVISPISTAATADFAGSLAFASKFYQKEDKEFAQKLLDAALKAQEYLNHHDDEIFINPPEITTGSYGDRNVSDERYFALCAIWDATENPEYLKKALEIRENEISLSQKKENETEKKHFWHEDFGWGLMAGFGTEILINNSQKIGDEETVQKLKDAIIKNADASVKTAQKSAFLYASKFYGWGSNGAVCDQAHLLMLAFKITGKTEYKTIAKAQIDYVLGCNPLNYCYVTCCGSKSPEHPHHRPSGAAKKVMPGMLVGGPCSGLNDEYARTHLQNLPALKCYADTEPSYSTNEIAIYWNSAFVYVLSQIGL